MALVKTVLKESVYSGLYKVLSNQAKKATSGDENESPDEIIKQIANDMAVAIADSVDAYIKSGDIIVGPSNITVTSPTGSCVVAPLTPAKMT